MVKLLWYSFLFIFLTALTQIGGIVLLISLLIFSVRSLKTITKVLMFIGLYFVTTFILIPPLAQLYGREKIKNGKPTNYMSVILNRNYVKPELNVILSELESLASYENANIHYLDANFPFLDGFPLLPHLSHNDGKKIDISLVYESPSGKLSDKQKSVSGYGVFEGPKDGEPDQIATCKKAGYFQYDYPKYLTFGEINKDLQFSEKGTKLLIEVLLKFDNMEKIFIEPHLKSRLGLTNSKIRYHGCGAVRHDDHIHIQVK